jgi:hypothetical protein
MAQLPDHLWNGGDEGAIRRIYGRSLETARSTPSSQAAAFAQNRSHTRKFAIQALSELEFQRYGELPWVIATTPGEHSLHSRHRVLDGHFHCDLIGETYPP